MIHAYFAEEDMERGPIFCDEDCVGVLKKEYEFISLIPQCTSSSPMYPRLSREHHPTARQARVE